MTHFTDSTKKFEQKAAEVEQLDRKIDMQNWQNLTSKLIEYSQSELKILHVITGKVMKS